ncbi:MAG: MATE family efflux transporter [Kaiparowitsia implicata GSE-PSE-MK54-09C]|jgi:MATE family multidrug resistance protein|nr:MATE family efflux transporter [Kaiparowitsia implicata GSE-PSE-MK54-09C]
MNGIAFRSKIRAEVGASLTLALPLAAAQLTQSATGFVDTVMMGRLGSQTIAAGGLGATVFTSLLLISSALLSAVSPLVAEAFGAGDRAKVQRVLHHGLLLAIALGLPLSLLLWHAAPVLRALGQSPENVLLSQTYLRAVVFGLLPGMLFAVLRNVVAALSQPRPVMIIILGGTLFNIAANYGLMLGKWGLPALGLAGIGWASSLSFTGMVIALSVYILRYPHLRQYVGLRQLLPLPQVTGAMLRELLQIGVPIGVLAGMEVGLFTATTFLMGYLGTTTLAAHQIALQTAAITFMVPLGVSYATTVRVGQLIGQQKFEAARLAGYIGIGMGCLFMMLTAVVFWTVPEAIVSLYLDVDDPANQPVVALAQKLLAIAAMFQVVDGIQVTAAGALRGLKDTRIPMMIGIVAYWGVGLTSGYVLGVWLGFGGEGLWWGLAIGLAVAAVVLTWRFRAMQIRPSELSPAS